MIYASWFPIESDPGIYTENLRNAVPAASRPFVPEYLPGALNRG